MADESDAQDKTEEPSQYRIDEFRKKGQVAASKELNSVLVLAATLLTLGLSILFFVETLDGYIRWLYGLKLDQAFTDEMLEKILDKTMMAGFKCIGPIFIVAFCISIISQVMQIGFLYAPDVLELKLERINPVEGFKKLFSAKSIAEVTKGIFKFSIIIIISVLILFDELSGFSGYLQSDLLPGVLHAKELIMKVGFLVILGLIVVAVGDFAWEKYSYHQKLKQSKQQIKEEMKEKEGNPEIKQRIRSIQREASHRRMMSAVPTADVIVTNPTHISIAIKYDQLEMIAPEVIAKGADNVALKIREIAKENNIPIVENVQLARTLYKTVKINEGVPRTLYKAVAEVLAFVYKMKGKIKQKVRA